MNNSINAVGRDDELSLLLVVAYWLGFISTFCEQVSGAAVVCNSGTVGLFAHSDLLLERKKQRNAERQ